jgi:hypothetical protein
MTIMSEMKSNPMEGAGLRERLTPEERARIQALLAANPDSRDMWQAELNLNRLLRDLPVTPVSSNFTRQVLDAALCSAKPAARHRWLEWLRLFKGLHGARTAPTLALITLVFGTGLVFYRQHQVQVRLQVAQSVAQVSDIASILNPEVLQNFDVISRLGEVPSKVDEELLLALK